eukprot:TRINITY_DN7051_c0_g1_i2.p1 TRINITY_DN7051_c0_g1~~TRINITY_DN7051_c0_g1_i2.p1  ORF type:complete len:289 (-),score=68.06 TRINITY_DN7051_c0_g1_i2:252-1118(-)
MCIRDRCFTQPISLGLSLFGFAVAIFAYKKCHPRIGLGAFYFTLMEFLQYLQYFVVDNGDGVMCKTFENQFLTWLGYLHISFQPWITHYMVGCFSQHPVTKKINEYTLRLCFVGGVWFLARNGLWLLGFGDPEFNKSTAVDSTGMRVYDWIPDSGAGMCTIQGDTHIGWSIPVHQHTYLVPSTSIHSFLMFAPFLCCGKTFLEPKYLVYGLFLFFAGPFISVFLIAPEKNGGMSGNKTALNEQAAIWCYISILQIFCMAIAAYVLDPLNNYKKQHVGDKAGEGLLKQD